MKGNDPELLVRYLEGLRLEPAELERVAKGVQAISDRVRAVAAARLAFEDEPAAFDRTLDRTRLP